MIRYTCFQCEKDYFKTMPGKYRCENCLNPHYPAMGNIVLVRTDMHLISEDLFSDDKRRAQG